MRERRREDIQTLWRQHMARPFPPRLRGEEINGIDMVMLDADIAGCLTTWLHSASDLDAWRAGVLRQSLDMLRRVLPALSDPDEVAYYSGLRDLAAAALADQSS